jgi:hypothetical protein
MLQLILGMDPSEIEKKTASIIGTWPNTYTFSKAITEHILWRRKGSTPLCIIRPTIVGAAYEEPLPGIGSLNIYLTVTIKSDQGGVTL